ncbi:MAG: NifU family protein [Anaerolineaceae bacterium]|nr:NifU family protein [Anaerolineaceae bacterium]
MDLKGFEHNHNHTRNEKVRGLVNQLDAYIAQYHGGRVEFVALKGDTLTVRMGGACVECPLQPATLKGWVEGTIHQFFPEITNVVNIK